MASGKKDSAEGCVLNMGSDGAGAYLHNEMDAIAVS